MSSPSKASSGLSPSLLGQLQSELRSAVGPIRNATVALGRDGRGSGVVIADGVVLTNAHVLRDTTISVRFATGRVAQAEVRGIDADGDLAALAVDTTDATPLAWAESAGDAGSIVLAGHGNGTVTMGMVSGTGRTFRGPRGRLVSDSIEHTAPLSRGASGGPVVNLDGDLVAINTARHDASYRAIAVSTELRSRIEQLISGHSVERPVLGISVVPAAAARKVRQAAGLSERDGVLIQAVAPESAAAAAGLAQGDLIVGANETPVTSIDDLNLVLDRAIAATPLPSPITIELVVVRGSVERNVVVCWSRE